MVYKKGRVGRGNHLVLYADLALRTTIAISIRFLFIYSIHILKWPSKIRNCFFIFVFLICQLSVIKFYYSICTCVCVCVVIECFVYTQMGIRESAVFGPAIHSHSHSHSHSHCDARSLSSCSTDKHLYSI